MYDLTDIKTIKTLLSAENTYFTKSLGQNFLIDPYVCPKMAQLCGVDGNTGVIEIGPGIGVLTAELAKRAAKVVSIELDTALLPILHKTLSDYNNITVINADALKIDFNDLIKQEFGGMKVSVCANLPYYITSPVIMKLLENRLPIESITVMVQKEAAERLCAKVGNRQSGAITVAAEFYARREELFDVPRTAFLPPPNVDSRVIKLTPRDEIPFQIKNTEAFFKMVKAGFGQRRKTLVNALSSGLPLEKKKIRKALLSAGLDENVRIEALSMKQLAELCSGIFTGASENT